MLKNYIKMAFRNLMRHKVFSLINIAGLALGMTCSILILLWVQDEVSFDKFHENIDQLYRVMEVQHYPGNDDLITDANPGPLAEALEKDMPEVKYAVRSTTWEWKQLFTYEDKIIKVNGRHTDPEFFEVFSFPLLHGDPKQVLQEPNSVVISASTAQKFFGTTDAVGKIFKINNSASYQVTGVMQDVPKNSSFQFDYVMPLNDWINTPGGEWVKDWSNNGIRTYVLLQPGADVAAVNKKIEGFIKKYAPKSNADLFLQPISEMHLYSDFRPGKDRSGMIVYVRLFSVVAAFLIIIACINFMNLATARSAKRAKEVGVRKAIGAGKNALVQQFMLESVLVAFLALFLSLNLVGIVLPQFNNLTGKAITLDLSDPGLILILLGVALVTGLISGSYPAFFLSSFNPAVVLKGTVKLSSKVSLFRKGLVVFQFVLSALLIVSTLVVYLQLHYIRTKDIGLNRENVVQIPIEGEIGQRYDMIKQEFLKQAGITGVTAANQSPLMIGNSTGHINWAGKAPDADILFSIIYTELDFLETMNIQVKEGRGFSEEYGADTANVLINEEAARLMQLENPVGEWLEGGGQKAQIIGVVKDFHSSSVQEPMQPLILLLNSGAKNTMFARIAPGQAPGALAAMEKVLKKYNPAFPFTYHFLDEDFEKMYKSEAIIGELTNYFAGIAILISCMGLFGLALFTAEQRTKEIGIRKVLGASTSGIVFMLSKDFLKLVLLANIVALPLSWYLMSNWLDDYAYRTELSWWIFAAAFVATIIIAMLTLSFHAIKTAVANPVNSLRTE
ncbi:ABC transporter permease [Pontibacter sp. SGAir0037]|uniref:ABC transporter permease n=1 Tax=Pontibacter sp. SGAir0037 TaxID=2571030 RepID=UPI0010CCD588|nr:ABC transporter permease [Pontibacter sp. SGAir0037]QCR25106.1 hypothetical protein C1N53_15395 [Pontibacter sp. SGAir0037]